jgi:hypothetical protein
LIPSLHRVHHPDNYVWAKGTSYDIFRLRDLCNITHD